MVSRENAKIKRTSREEENNFGTFLRIKNDFSSNTLVPIQIPKNYITADFEIKSPKTHTELSIVDKKWQDFGHRVPIFGHKQKSPEYRVFVFEPQNSSSKEICFV